MYTSLACLAFTCCWAARVDRPVWHGDYYLAQELGARQKKPIAVFFGEGERGHESWCRNGNLTKEAVDLLTQQYVCVFVDVGRDDGRKLAETFAISNSRGLVISDRTGGYQAFHYNGSLANGELTRCLDRFADPSAVFRATVTYPPTTNRTSYYPYGSSFTPVTRASITLNC